MVSSVSAVRISNANKMFGVCHLDCCRCSVKGTYALRAPLSFALKWTHIAMCQRAFIPTASTFISHLIATTDVMDQKNCRWIFVSDEKCLATGFNGYPWNVSTNFSGSEACKHRFISTRTEFERKSYYSITNCPQSIRSTDNVHNARYIRHSSIRIWHNWSANKMRRSDVNNQSNDDKTFECSSNGICNAFVAIQTDRPLHRLSERRRPDVQLDFRPDASERVCLP